MERLRLRVRLLIALAVAAIAFIQLPPACIHAHHASRAAGKFENDNARTAADIDLIEFEIKNLNRPHLLLDNSVLVQEIDADGDAELTKYRWMTVRPGDGDWDVNSRRTHKSRVVLKRPGIEVGQNVIIFNSGKHAGFGPATDRTYVVLRKYEKVAHPHTYLVNLVYIWHIGTRQEIHIEWSSFDEVDYLALNTDNKIERALCRNEDCDFPQWIFGTCAILSRDCSEVLTTRDESEITFSEESDEDEDEPGCREGDWRSFARKTRRHSKHRRMRHTRDRDGDDSKEKDGRLNTWIVGPGIRVRVSNRDKDRHDDNKDKAWDIDEDNHGSSSKESEPKRNWWKWWQKDKKKSNKRPSYRYRKYGRGRRKSKNDHEHEHDGDGGTELGFKNEVDKDDRVRESLLDVELRQICYDCQSIGNFYDEYLEEAKNSNKIGWILKKQQQRTSASTRWWWARTHRKEPAGAASTVPFIGFGDCGEHQLLELPRSPRHPKTAQLDDVIEFYVETLRVQCKPEMIDELRSWLTTKLNFTHVQPDLTLGLIPTSLIMKYNLLSKDEYEMLFSAALLSQYTMRFVEETNLGLSSASVASAKDQAVQRQQQLSPRTAFLKRLTLRFLTYIQYNIPQHYVKLTRSMIQLLLDKFHTLLAQRVELLKSSRRVARLGFEQTKEHSKRIALNYNDLQQIMGLKEHIIFGTEPSLKSGLASKDAFTSFYVLNEQRMKFLVDSYRIHA